MQVLSRFEPRPGRTLLLALIAFLAAVALVVAARPAGAAGPGPVATTCPGFRVLHDDRIGAAVFPVGSYTLTLQDTSLNCKSSAALFARFLEDYDGVLPKPWTVANEGPGKAAFLRNGTSPGFSVELTAKNQENAVNPDL